MHYSSDCCASTHVEIGKASRFKERMTKVRGIRSTLTSIWMVSITHPVPIAAPPRLTRKTISRVVMV